MSYTRFSYNSGRDAERISRKTISSGAPTQQSPPDSIYGPTQTPGIWVRMDADGRVLDSDLSADALLARYAGSERPRIAFVEKSPE